MKNLKSSAAAKLIAAVLIVCALAACLASAAGIALLENFGAYSGGYDTAKTAVLDAVCQDRCYEAANNFTNYSTAPDEFYPDSAFRFTISDSEGNVVYDNLGGETVISSCEAVNFNSNEAFFAGSTHTVYVNTEIDGQPQPSVKPETDAGSDAVEDSYARRSYTLNGYIIEDIPETDDLALFMRVLNTAYSLRYGLFAIAIIAFLIAAALFVFLMRAAGHKSGGELRGGFIEKIPFDLFTAAIVGIEALVGYAALGLLEYSSVYWLIRALLSGICAAAFLLIGLWWCMSWAARIKLHTALRGCVIYKLLAWLWRGIKRFAAFLGTVARGLPLIPRAAIICLAVLLVEFLFIAICGGDTGAQLLGWFFERAILAALLLYALLQLRSLQEAGRELASGNMSYTVDTAKMRGAIREHGEDLNNISAGMNMAVAERMKSERFKTELITNVSHDIRTPLTSIISYVDLLAKENPQSEKEREYIAVLERQSARLKKLIDDLIEASKASSGSLNVELERCEMGVLLGQVAGEYGEKLERAQLELVLDKPEDGAAIMADGRHMWRILDNLLNNACKYSLPGTRVYLTLEKKDGRAVVSVKNVSKTKLNISGDELMERFVRGDGARNTEGSGLGLSIARSLTQLQRGDMEISIDGDLFKVTLSFPEAE